MLAKKILLSLFFLLPACLSAQSGFSVKGVVGDTASSIKLLNTSVSVLRAKDSVLCKFTRASREGAFSISGLPKGKLILLVTYPGYADYVEHFILDSTKREIDFGNINMILKSTLLQDVIIKGKAVAIKIKGDTTEYNAGSFEIQPNSKVEDLLKQLPGIQVDQSGKITAQGQTVQKVLVDGEEFFGDDPTLVTKNVRADMVDKVQLYDKKSDQATFTGIDDGERTKTINLKLKEDKKNGFFGKSDVGGGNDQFYEGQAMFNAFKGKKKFAVYGTISNTGKTGLGWNDNTKYGAASNVEFTDDGGIMIMGGGGDELDSFDGRYNGEGIPSAKNAGAHYDSKWNNDKQSVNANYKIGSLGVEGSKDVLSQKNLSDGVILGNSSQLFDNFVTRQKLDVTYQVKFDTTSTLRVSVDGTAKRNETRTNYASFNRNGDEMMLNDENRRVTNNGDSKVFNASALWTMKFRKKGRTLSLNLNGSINQNDSKGFLASRIRYYKNGDSTGVRDIDQYKTGDADNESFRGNLTYTEPLAKNFSVVLNYGFSGNSNQSDRRSFNLSTDGRYDQLDTAYSNNYTFNQYSNQGGMIFNYRKGQKTTVNFGSRVSAVNFNQKDEYRGSRFKRSFTNWMPEASLQHRFSQQRSYRVSYRGNTNQPGISQIQPLRENTDPLNVTEGNPDLKPSFTNRFDMNYNSYKVLTERSIWISGSYGFTMDPIVNNSVIDSSGNSIYRSFNLKDKNSTNMYLSAYFDRKLKKLGVNAGLNFYVSGNTSYNYINSALNKTNSYSYSGGISLSKYKEKKYQFNVSFNPNYNISESSLQKNLNNNGMGYFSRGEFMVYLPWKLQLSSDGNYEYREKTESFNSDFRRFIWNASLDKTFTKKDQLRLSLKGYDLLNQNKGFDRYASGTSLTETNYTNIRRYFMLSLIWDFNKMGGAPKQ
ncbi:outer membrane beta-barrel protein [Pararcticibacter amylolyticus]|uniref:TonB-dependent receptor n=1 Tax=Pararcticibacter amylolyticus TaxID=2173175 RepID=A0A2U2PLY2_9SPHI|nr:outer membrane beta-barrel protein [Pararcticibacter amylolyticus]PWG82413.1 TonB-dependent receptor [Pararcticibacter amylolyticus]